MALGVLQAEELTQRQMREPPSLDHLRALAGERMRNSPPRRSQNARDTSEGRHALAHGERHARSAEDTRPNADGGVLEKAPGGTVARCVSGPGSDTRATDDEAASRSPSGATESERPQ